MSLCRWVKDVMIGSVLNIVFSTGHRRFHSLTSAFRDYHTSVIFKNIQRCLYSPLVGSSLTGFIKNIVSVYVCALEKEKSHASWLLKVGKTAYL